jgi:hypothetical protein
MRKNLLPLLALAAICSTHEIVYAQVPVLTAYTRSTASTETRNYLYSNLSGTTNYRYRFGLSSRPAELNDFWVDSFTVTGGSTYSYRPVPGYHVEMRRVNNPAVTGIKNLIYADGTVTSGSSPDTINIFCTYDTDMETLYSNNKGLTTGTDNMFNNATGNNNNIERIDMIIPGGISALPGQEPGFALFERGNNGAHDPIKAALILALDGSGNPSQYSNIVSVTAANYGTGTLLAGTRNYVILSQQLPADTALKYSTQVGNQNIAGTFILFTSFGVAETATVYGYSLIPNDFPGSGTPADLVDYTNPAFFPLNTTEANGGIDLIAISGIVANVLMPEPLPLTFVSFDLRLTEEDKVVLNWKTEREDHMKETDVQRSADGKTWQHIGSVALDNSNKYTYTDHTPLAGTSYYRLGFTSTDGNTRYSPVRSIKIQPKITVKISPNPIKDQASISLSGPLGEEGVLQLVNGLGQVVHSVKVPNQQQISIDLRSMASGLYYLVLRNGSQISYKERFVKL